MVQYEIIIDIPERQNVLVLDRSVAQFPTLLRAGYYHGEDLAGGAPFKIEVKTGINQTQEISFTVAEIARLLRFFSGWLKARKNHTSDDDELPPLKS